MEDVDVFPQHQVDRGVRVEPGEQDEGAAGPEAGVHADGLAEGVEQRQAAQYDVGVADLVGVERGDGGVHDEVEMGEHGAFGFAGGAAGVEDDGRVVRSGGLGHWEGGGGVGELVQRRDGRRPVGRPVSGDAGVTAGGGAADGDEGDAGLGRGGGAHGGQRVVADEQVGSAVPQDVGHLRGGEQQVDGDDDAAGGEGPVVGGGELHGVGGQQGDGGTRSGAQLAEGGGVAEGTLPEFGVGDAVVAVDDTDLVRVSERGFAQDAGEGEGRGHASSSG